MQRSHVFGLLFLIGCGLVPTAAAATPTDFQPDQHSVQWYGPAYRYPQAGWTVLHIEGQPYERGYQHGRLMAPEIAAFVRTSATMMSPGAPSEGWKNARTLINALFLRRYDREFLEEMKGIADGATAAGARYDNRPIDLVDIVGVNVWPEIETLDSALEATPTGLEGMRFPHSQPRERPAPKPMHCSAFAATGPATVDGKVVFGHITMFGLYASYFYNVWIDVKPAKGHRVLMQSYPGGIQSGLDYYMNDAGILVAETTIAQTRFDITGNSLASRIRQALQYADSIDQAVEILKTANNGLYTNEWLLADTKTNEIAMFELGTAKTKLYRSSRGEWFGGTPGFYWGCNNTKDVQVRLETISSVNDRPANVCFCPSDRDQKWVQLYHRYKGKMDADFGKLAFTTPPLAAYHSLDAKFTTTDLAKELKTWALFGPPLGHTWQPTQEERKRYPDIRPLVSNPWTVLHAGSPVKEPPGPLAMDVPERMDNPVRAAMRQRDEGRRPSTRPAWHGTLLPKTDGDVWLAAGFADYERIVAREKGIHEQADGEEGHAATPTSGDRERLATELYGYRSAYASSARIAGDVPLARVHADVATSDWYRVANGKGVLVLQELRKLLGSPAFEEMMDSFGRAHAGKEVPSADFQVHAEKVAGKSLAAFFDYWLHQPGLPAFMLEKASAVQEGPVYRVTGEIVREGPAPATSVDVTVETDKGEETKTIATDSTRTEFTVETKQRPRRLVVDKYGTTAKANGGTFSVLTFYGELEHALIVYGTADETPTNREAAEALQRAIIERHSNITVPIKTDREVTEEELKSHHLLVIGRPDSNPLVERFRNRLPVTFGKRSFTLGHETYAHAGTAVAVAAENPLNPRYSLVVIAGMSPEATYHAPSQLFSRGRSAAEVLVLPNHGRTRSLVVPARDLVTDFDGMATDEGGKVSRNGSGKP